MIKRVKELAAEMKPALLDLAQRAIRCPSLSGQEGAVSEIFLSELLLTMPSLGVFLVGSYSFGGMNSPPISAAFTFSSSNVIP